MSRRVAVVKVSEGLLSGFLLRDGARKDEGFLVKGVAVTINGETKDLDTLYDAKIVDAGFDHQDRTVRLYIESELLAEVELGEDMPVLDVTFQTREESKESAGG